MAFDVGVGCFRSAWVGRRGGVRKGTDVSCDASAGSMSTVTAARRRVARERLARS